MRTAKWSDPCEVLLSRFGEEIHYKNNSEFTSIRASFFILANMNYKL